MFSKFIGFFEVNLNSLKFFIIKINFNGRSNDINNKMNIGIIGQGFVGNAVYQKFKNFYNVYTFDIRQK